jgi:hypothetical protein
LTQGVIAAGGSIIEQGGVRAFIRLLRKDKKAAMRMVAAAGKAGLKGAGIDIGSWRDKAKKLARRRMSGLEDIVPVDPVMVGMGALYDHDAQPANTGTGYILQQQSRRGRMSKPFSAAPIVAFAGAYGVIETGDMDIAATPTPGKWYQINPDVARSLSKTASIAYGTSGGTNLVRQKWINAVQANAYAFDPTATDNLHKNGKITFLPKFSKDSSQAVQGVPGNHWATIWIPEHEGDEPPEAVDPADDPTDDPIIPDIPDVEDPIDPKTNELPKTEDPECPPGMMVEMTPGGGYQCVGDPSDPKDPIVGPPGETGAIGPMGPAGSPGLPGGMGPQGVVGPIGPRGEPGVGEGQPGEQGAMGPAGEPGMPGGMGPQGEPGEMGPEGSVGPIGPEGPMGPAGEGGTGGGVPGWVPVVAAMFIGGWFK